MFTNFGIEQIIYLSTLNCAPLFHTCLKLTDILVRTEKDVTPTQFCTPIYRRLLETHPRRAGSYTVRRYALNNTVKPNLWQS